MTREDGLKFPHRLGEGAVLVRGCVRRRNGTGNRVWPREGSTDEPENV